MVTYPPGHRKDNPAGDNCCSDLRGENRWLLQVAYRQRCARRSAPSRPVLSKKHEPLGSWPSQNEANLSAHVPGKIAVRTGIAVVIHREQRETDDCRSTLAFVSGSDTKTSQGDGCRSRRFKILLAAGASSVRGTAPGRPRCSPGGPIEQCGAARRSAGPRSRAR
jgi:hypothetical protein